MRSEYIPAMGYWNQPRTIEINDRVEVIAIGARSEVDAVVLSGANFRNEVVITRSRPFIGRVRGRVVIRVLREFRTANDGGSEEGTLFLAAVELDLYDCVPPIIPTVRAPMAYSEVLNMTGTDVMTEQWRKPVYGRNKVEIVLTGYAGNDCAFKLFGWVISVLPDGAIFQQKTQLWPTTHGDEQTIDHSEEESVNLSFYDAAVHFISLEAYDTVCDETPTNMLSYLEAYDD